MNNTPHAIKRWTESLVTSELTRVASSLGRMPTYSELTGMGMGGLANAASRIGGGLREWARRLNVAYGYSDSDFGWDGEKLMVEIFESHGHSAIRQMAVRSPFDIIVDEVLRVDVKVAKFAEYGCSRGWFYRIGKIPQADVVALLQYDTKDVYFFPWHMCPTTNITISRDGGSHKEFKNRYDIIRELIAHRKQEMLLWPHLNPNRKRRKPAA